jgi:imidazole glycerol-phosphate synthase subunit HisF
MLRTRIIPTLLLMNESLVKTTQFKKYTYVGDPCNTVRIFNELEVDELVFLDINASKQGRGPNLKLLKEIANECFMPLAYGGGISCLDDAKRVFDVGFEKVILNTYAIRNPELISEIAKQYGNQAVMISIDIKKDFFGRKKIYSNGGRKQFKLNPVDWCKNVEKLGAGEILLTSIDNEGTWSGFDLDLIKLCVDSVSIPVIAHGGAGSVNHVKQAIKTAGASAVALGSMVVFQKKNMGVLVNVADFSAALD